MMNGTAHTPMAPTIATTQGVPARAPVEPVVSPPPRLERVISNAQTNAGYDRELRAAMRVFRGGAPMPQPIVVDVNR